MAGNFTEITMLNSLSVQLHYHSIFLYRILRQRAKAVALPSMLDKLWGIPRFLSHLFLAIDLQESFSWEFP